MKIDGYAVSNPIGFTGSHSSSPSSTPSPRWCTSARCSPSPTQLGLDLMGVIAEPYAVATCLVLGEVGDAGAVFIDVGGGTTDVAWCATAASPARRCSALAGRAFTKGVAERFNLPFSAAAEAAKLASDLPESVVREPTSTRRSRRMRPSGCAASA